MKYLWSLAPSQPALTSQLAEALKLTPLTAQCLVNRGFTDTAQVSAFLEPRLRQLADPFLLPGMEAAVERLLRARELRERLVVFGDYDVDGVTSTALLIQVLSALGWHVSYYLPHRFDEGYGLTREAVETCISGCAPSLLLAVDCGSTSCDSIAWLKTRGVDVIVLDHHQTSAQLPEATALVNPQVALGRGPLASSRMSERGHAAPQPPGLATYGGRDSSAKGFAGSVAPSFAELCSAGLAFKLAHALVKRGRDQGLAGFGDFDLRSTLDLVALGTIADIVPLTGENRILATAGLARLNKTERAGLVALKRVAQCSGPTGTYEVAFQLAPRLNAAGRLESAEDALRLLLAQTTAEAMSFAQKLDAANRERQQIERGIVEDVVGMLESKFKPDEHYVIVEGQGPWHIGVVGIVAARVLRQFYRPTIIVGGEGEEWRGSGRSIAGFDLAAALRQCDNLLLRHGGHAMAAGVTLRRGKLDEFRARLNDVARSTLGRDALQPPLRLDAQVALREVTMQCLEELARLNPTGQGNPGVQLCARGLRQQRPAQRMGAEKQHLKMWVTDGACTHEAVWWGAGERQLPEAFDLAFVPQVNEFNGRRNIQLKVLDCVGAQPEAHLECRAGQEMAL